jgi:hypothetical protein
VRRKRKRDGKSERQASHLLQVLGVEAVRPYQPAVLAELQELRRAGGGGAGPERCCLIIPGRRQREEM